MVIAIKGLRHQGRMGERETAISKDAQAIIAALELLSGKSLNGGGGNLAVSKEVDQQSLENSLPSTRYEV